jgi:DNA polymerase-3 subunit epsilon
MILVFDTETTGFYDERSAPDAACQPYIVQLAAKLFHDDGRSVLEFCFIVEPGISGHGLHIPEKASAVHGITDEVAVQFGMNAESALVAFTHLYQRADLIVAHNMKFDRAIIETAIARHYKRLMPLRKPLFCTMEAAAPVINLPPTERMVAAGMNKPKAPKLQECVKHFFGEEIDGAHDAMIDVDACARVYFHLQKLAVADSKGVAQ